MRKSHVPGFQLSSLIPACISSAELVRRFIWRFVKYVASQFPPLVSQTRDTTRATRK